MGKLDKVWEKVNESTIIPNVIGLVIIIAFFMTITGWCIWSFKWVLSLLFGV